jgi:hypothetical protein
MQVAEGTQVLPVQSRTPDWVTVVQVQVQVPAVHGWPIWGEHAHIVPVASHPRAQAVMLVTPPQLYWSMAQSISVLLEQYSQAVWPAGQVQSNGLQVQLPFVHVALGPHVPLAHPTHVGVPHWHVGSGVPPTQLPLQSIVPLHVLALLHDMP